MGADFDFDQVVVGSGFGGACSALRLSEKGYRVLVLEKGKRWRDKDFSQNSWNYRKLMWVPVLGLFGNIQMTITRKVTAIHGVGVGGGSLVYANVHMIPKDEIFASKPWSQVHPDWRQRLEPFYGLAQRMLGTAHNEYTNVADSALLKTATAMGRKHTFETVNTGVLFPEDVNDNSGRGRGDPYFAGDGPERNDCRFCAGCILGCRHNAKNTLEKNYLWFAERNGVEIRPETEVIRINALPDQNGNRDGGAGYELTVQSATRWFRKQRHTIRTRGVVLSAGVFGTVPLLLKARDVDGTLPDISRQLGREVRTNSETLIMNNCEFKDEHGQSNEVSDGLFISSLFDPDDETRIEINRFPRYGDACIAMQSAVPLTDAKGRIPRQILLLANLLRHPLKALRMLNPIGKAPKTVVFLVMQTRDTFIHMTSQRKWYKLFRPGWAVRQEPGDTPLSNYFPVAHEAARHYVAAAGGGEAGNVLTEVLTGAPTTAHLIGGVAIGSSPDNGVVDDSGQVFGYRNLRVIDGSLVPGNLGVNPSLTILALAEYAMTKIPVFDETRAAGIKPIRFSKPLPGQVSRLNGEGDLHKQAMSRSLANTGAQAPSTASVSTAKSADIKMTDDAIS